MCDSLREIRKRERNKKWGEKRELPTRYREIFRKEERKVERRLKLPRVSNNRKAFERELLRSSFEIKNIYNIREIQNFSERFEFRFNKIARIFDQEIYLKIKIPLKFPFPFHFYYPRARKGLNGLLEQRNKFYVYI